MTEQQFDYRIHQIDEEYSRRREGADAYRDQELARLFNECRWTQERIARKMGKTQAWVAFRLVFGRFLIFITSGYKDTPGLDSLTERAFRKFYSGTRGTETERFEFVVAKLKNAIPIAIRHMIKKPGYAEAAREVMSDGKWHTAAQLQEELVEKFPEIDTHAVTNAISHLLRKPPKGMQMQSKKIGKRCQYKLVAAKEQKPSVSSEAMNHFTEKITPILDELKYWGQAHEAQMSPHAIRRLAAELEKAIEPLMVCVPS